MGPSLRMLLVFLCAAVAVCSAENSSDDTDMFIVVGGLTPEAPFQYDKYLVSLRHNVSLNYFGNQHFCAGTIYSAHFVITAARCLIDEELDEVLSLDKVKVLTGVNERTVQSPRLTVHEVQLVVPHKDFNRRWKNDIGLVKTTKPIVMVETLIEHVPINFAAVSVGERCVAVGWRRLFERGPMANEAMEVDLEVYDARKCAEIEDFDSLGNLCVGSVRGNQADACQGDSGGPLFCNGQQAGIVLQGNSQCKVGVFTNISHFKDWILANT